MTRRPAALTVTAVAMVAVLSFGALSSCSTFDERSSVASVDGDALDEDEFEDIATNPFVTGQTQESSASTVSGGTARDVIGTWVVVTVLANEGWLAPVTDEDAAAALDASGVPDWNTDDEAVPFLLNLAKTNILLSNGAIDPEAAAELFAAADVHVASRYGVWDPPNVVRALGEPAE